MPWVDDKSTPQPVQQTGESAPNPFRTWENDVIDALPVLAGIVVLVAAIILINHYGPRLRAKLAAINKHLRTPVQ